VLTHRAAIVDALYDPAVDKAAVILPRR